MAEHVIDRCNFCLMDFASCTCKCLACGFYGASWDLLCSQCIEVAYVWGCYVSKTVTSHQFLVIKKRTRRFPPKAGHWGQTPEPGIEEKAMPKWLLYAYEHGYKNQIAHKNSRGRFAPDLARLDQNRKEITVDEIKYLPWVSIRMKETDEIDETAQAVDVTSSREHLNPEPENENYQQLIVDVENDSITDDELSNYLERVSAINDVDKNILDENMSKVFVALNKVEKVISEINEGIEQVTAKLHIGEIHITPDNLVNLEIAQQNNSVPEIIQAIGQLVKVPGSDVNSESEPNDLPDLIYQSDSEYSEDDWYSNGNTSLNNLCSTCNKDKDLDLCTCISKNINDDEYLSSVDSYLGENDNENDDQGTPDLNNSSDREVQTPDSEKSDNGSKTPLPYFVYPNPNYLLNVQRQMMVTFTQMYYDQVEESSTPAEYVQMGLNPDINWLQDQEINMLWGGSRERLPSHSPELPDQGNVMDNMNSPLPPIYASDINPDNIVTVSSDNSDTEN